MEKLQIEKINLEYFVAVVFLGISLLAGIIYGEKELAINIASGIIGYIGGRGVGYASAVRQPTPPQQKPADSCPVYGNARKGGKGSDVDSVP